MSPRVRKGFTRVECSVCGGSVDVPSRDFWAEQESDSPRPWFCSRRCLQARRVLLHGPEPEVWENGDGRKPIPGTGMTHQEATRLHQKRNAGRRVRA